MKDGRDFRGRFANGNRGGPGRPRRATEAEYLQALSRIVSVADLRAIARRAVADAKRGSARAREWVSKYLLGDPAPNTRSRANRRKRVSQELLQAIRDRQARDQAETVHAGERRSLEDPATGGPEAPAANGVATPFPSEGQQ